MLRSPKKIWNPGNQEKGCSVRCPQRSKSKNHFILRWDSARYSQRWYCLRSDKQRLSYCIVASFVPQSRDYGVPRPAYDAKGNHRSDRLSATNHVARKRLLVTLKNCRIDLPAWFAEFIRWHEPDGL
jgi:hypothetical protein